MKAKTVTRAGLTMTKRQQNAIDNQIQTIVSTHLSGVQINILDIGKVFDAGYAAVAAGADLTAAVVGKYQELRRN